MDVNEELKFCVNAKKSGGGGVEGQGGYERRIEVFVKIQKINCWGSGGGWGSGWSER